MNIKESTAQKVTYRVKSAIKKVQILPLWQRKVILWAIVTVLGVFFAFFWWNSVKEGLKNVGSSDVIKKFIPSVGEENFLPAGLEESQKEKQNGR